MQSVLCIFAVLILCMNTVFFFLLSNDTLGFLMLNLSNSQTQNWKQSGMDISGSLDRSCIDSRADRSTQFLHFTLDSVDLLKRRS